MTQRPAHTCPLPPEFPPTPVAPSRSSQGTELSSCATEQLPAAYFTQESGSPQLPRTLCDRRADTAHGILQASTLEWVAFPFSRDLPDPGIEPRSPALRADSSPAKPQWKPKNTGVGSLSLLQGIFLTQELNQGLLHCRRILYQLSYGEPWAVTAQSKISVFLCRWWCWWGEKRNRWWRGGWEKWAQRRKPTLHCFCFKFPSWWGGVLIHHLLSISMRFYLILKTWERHSRLYTYILYQLGFPGGTSDNPPANAGAMRDAGSIPGSGRSPGGGHSSPLQCSCLETPISRGTRWAAVLGVAKSQAQLERLSTHIRYQQGKEEIRLDAEKRLTKSSTHYW